MGDSVKRAAEGNALLCADVAASGKMSGATKGQPEQQLMGGVGLPVESICLSVVEVFGGVDWEECFYICLQSCGLQEQRQEYKELIHNSYASTRRCDRLSRSRLG